jgi:hypothetical protein
LASQKKNAKQIWSQLWISLSVWDYIFKTNYIPKDGRDIELGFNDENEFPHDLLNKSFIP